MQLYYMPLVSPYPLGPKLKLFGAIQTDHLFFGKNKIFCQFRLSMNGLGLKIIKLGSHIYSQYCGKMFQAFNQEK